MTHFFISDTHLGHTNIIRYDQRPFASTEEHDETIIQNWNADIKQNDTVWFGGDFAFMHGERLIKTYKRLNGKINIVFGNHDKELRKEIRRGNIVPQSVHELTQIKYRGAKIILCHYNMEVWNASYHGSWHLFGHSHGKTPNEFVRNYTDYKCEISVTAWNYKPASFDDIQKIMQDKEYRHLSGN